MKLKINNFNLNSVWNKRLTNKALSLLVLSSSLNPLIYNDVARAQGTTTENPYIENLKKSKPAMDNMNYYFSSALKEKLNHFNQSKTDVFGDKFFSSNYLIQPPLNIKIDPIPKGNKVDNCNLNDSKYVNHALNHIPIKKGGKKEFSESTQDSYCLLQHTFQNLSNGHIEFMTEPIFPPGNDFQKAKDNLEKSDTLVVVIPGIFGEFIESVAFGEVFGQGLTKLENGSNKPSNFTGDFNRWIETNKKKIKNSKLMNSKRVTLKDINTDTYPEFENGESKFYQDKNVSIEDWIKVSSYDENEKTLFKVAVLGLAPMSLESIGQQYNLSIIYLRRLNKFMEIYKQMYNKYPGRIVFVGYSRGTPVAYEMLSILNKAKFKKSSQSIEEEIQKKAADWKNNIKSMLSLGGVSLGSTLADASVIYRDHEPDKVKLLHAFRELMFNFQVITGKDIKEFKEYLSHKTEEAKVKAKAEEVKTKNEEVKQVTIDASLDIKSSLINKVIDNINNYKLFYARISKITSTNNEISLMKAGFELYGELQELYTNIANLIQEDQAQQSGIGTIQKVQTIANSVPQVAQKFNEFIEKFKEINSLLPALSVPSLSILDFKKFKTHFKNKVNQISELIPAADPDSDFNNVLFKNFGVSELNKTESDPYKVLIAINNMILRFKIFFQYAWDGGHELGTLARLSWLEKNAKHLPQKDFNYYTVNAVFGNTSDDYYQKGLNISFNNSTDQAFLVPSSVEIKSVGKLSSNDGLDSTFSGTEWNDSQVTWPKTILWEHLISKMTNGAVNINSKLIATVRTHHWGLALPLATYNKTKMNSATGKETDGAEIANVNPFPRKEFLLATLLTINEDSLKNKEESVKNESH